MFSTRQQPPSRAWTGLALLVLGLAPAVSQAETIVLRNDTNRAVGVQVTAVFRGNIQRSRPTTIYPRATASFHLPGDKHVVIYDAAMPTRVLHKETIPGAMINRAFSIEWTPQGRMRLQQYPFQGGPR